MIYLNNIAIFQSKQTVSSPEGILFKYPRSFDGFDMLIDCDC